MSEAGFQSTILSFVSSRPSSSPSNRLTRIKENQPVRSDEVDAATSSLGREKEDELLAVGVVELVDELLTLLRRHGAVQTEEAVAVVEREYYGSQREALEADGGREPRRTGCCGTASRRRRAWR